MLPKHEAPHLRPLTCSQQESRESSKLRLVPLPSAVFFICTNLNKPCQCLRAAHFTEEWALFGDTFDVLCFHMYKLQAHFENMSVLRILLEKAMPWPHLDLLCFHMYKLQSISILGSGGNPQLPRAKEINWTFQILGGRFYCFIGRNQNGFIFEIKFWLRVWSQSLSSLEFVASNFRLACLGSHRMRAERVVAALLWFYKHDSGSYWGSPFLRACFSYVLRSKKSPSLSYCFAPISIALSPQGRREACPDVVCSNFYGLATLEFKTCIEVCLQLCFIL